MSLLISMSAAATSDGQANIELRDGVLISPSQGVVYLMNPAGGIDGINLATGNVVWQTQEAQKPLMLDGDLLIAQGETEDLRQIQISTFDTRLSGRAENTMRVDLPKGVLGRVDAHLKGSLETRASLQGTGVLLTWDAETRFPRGISPLMHEQLNGPALDGQKVRRQLPSQLGYAAYEGAAILDLQQGIAKAIPTAELAIAKQGQVSGSGLREVVGASLRIDEPGRHFFSNDGQHVLVSARRAAEANGPRYAWTLFTADGERLGQVMMDVAAAPFAVVDGQLLTTLPMRADQTSEDWNVRPLRLQAFDLSSGLEEGSWEIRDLEFRGPFPQ